MGYSTDIKGRLDFNREISIQQYKKLKEFCGELASDHPEWENPQNAKSYIQWEVTKDLGGIEWDGNEKFYDIFQSLNLIIHNMRKEWPEFGVKGQLLCQGEDIDDRWHLKIGEDGLAYREDSEVKTVKCPECDHVWEAA